VVWQKPTTFGSGLSSSDVDGRVSTSTDKEAIVDTPRHRVLLLDTDSEFLISLEQVLEEEGFNTTTSWDARQAIELLGSDHFDVLLVGEHPPEVKSAELLNRLQAERRGIPCIVMRSAARYPFEAQYLCALGADAVVSRWKHELIVEKIRQILGHPHNSTSRAMTDAIPAAARQKQ
jgi:DNA-binding NtrC family response regulator